MEQQRNEDPWSRQVKRLVIKIMCLVLAGGIASTMQKIQMPAYEHVSADAIARRQSPPFNLQGSALHPMSEETAFLLQRCGLGAS
jgi:hypothetical protein